mgnify:CR=1 FL=1
MKNIISIIFSLFAIAVISSCSDEFLDQEPKGLITPSNFYNTEEDLISGLNAVYNELPFYFKRTHHVLGSDLADLTRVRATETVSSREFPNYFGTSDGRYNTRLWTGGYQIISNANAVIENLVGKENLSEELKKRADAEARFFRSLMYYYLVTYFGDVPLILSPISSVSEAYSERTSAADVFQQIIDDLMVAKQNLPKNSEYNGVEVLRPSTGAASMLLAKIYFTQREWDAALDELNTIIESDEFALEPNYKDIWKLSNNLVGQENILEIYFAPGDLNGGQRSMFQQWRLPRYFFRGWEATYASDQLIEKFDTAVDLRYKDIFVHNSFMGEEFAENDRHVPVWKFFDPEAYDLDIDLKGPYKNNWILFRYADVLLMKAEALLETGASDDEVEAYLNQIRNRAGLDDIDLSGMSMEEKVQEIFDERARELYMEGHRSVDLKNRGAEFFKRHVEPRLGSEIPESRLLLPIPSIEVQANPNIIQNPGY